MGHSTISVTSDLYGHLFEKASKRMAKRAAKLVPRAKTAAKDTASKKQRRKAA
jgi:hypothetical protein